MDAAGEQDDLASEGTVVFVVATYGEGEPTDNAKDFYAWLMDDDRQPDLLERVRFAVFGCVTRASPPLGPNGVYPPPSDGSAHGWSRRCSLSLRACVRAVSRHIGTVSEQ
jgi:hypothetical protein